MSEQHVVPAEWAFPAEDSPPPPPSDHHGFYVKFGPGQTDEMPILWAQRGLTWLKDNRPAVFADMMLAVLGVERASRKRGDQ